MEASLVAQWQRIRLLDTEDTVRSLIQEDPQAKEQLSACATAMEPEV